MAALSHQPRSALPHQPQPDQVRLDGPCDLPRKRHRAGRHRVALRGSPSRRRHARQDRYDTAGVRQSEILGAQADRQPRHQLRLLSDRAGNAADILLVRQFDAQFRLGCAAAVRNRGQSAARHAGQAAAAQFRSAPDRPAHHRLRPRQQHCADAAAADSQPDAAEPAGAAATGARAGAAADPVASARRRRPDAASTRTADAGSRARNGRGRSFARRKQSANASHDCAGCQWPDATDAAAGADAGAALAASAAWRRGYSQCAVVAATRSSAARRRRWRR